MNLLMQFLIKYIKNIKATPIRHKNKEGFAIDFFDKKDVLLWHIDALMRA